MSAVALVAAIVAVIGQIVTGLISWLSSRQVSTERSRVEVLQAREARLIELQDDVTSMHVAEIARLNLELSGLRAERDARRKRQQP